MVTTTERYNHHRQCMPLWGDDREWLVWREKEEQLDRERREDPTGHGTNTFFEVPDSIYSDHIKMIKDQASDAGSPGYNEYGIPLHACNGYRHDEHWWAWIGHMNLINKSSQEEHNETI